MWTRELAAWGCNAHQVAGQGADTTFLWWLSAQGQEEGAMQARQHTTF
jgi:hypothetical protein